MNNFIKNKNKFNIFSNVKYCERYYLPVGNEIDSMLKWHCKAFCVKVLYDKLRFYFDLYYLDEDAIKFNNIFLKRFKNEKLEDFFYNSYLDAFSFLNSVDFWNEFMNKIFYKQLLYVKDKIENGRNVLISVNPFILHKELLDILKQVKKDEKQKLLKVSFRKNILAGIFDKK